MGGGFQKDSFHRFFNLWLATPCLSISNAVGTGLLGSRSGQLSKSQVFFSSFSKTYPQRIMKDPPKKRGVGLTLSFFRKGFWDDTPVPHHF